MKRTWPVLRRPSSIRLVSAPALLILSSCGGGGAHGTDNAVGAATSPTSPITAYVGQTQTIGVAFTTNDGAPASALSMNLGASSLPDGWTSSVSSVMCASVATGNSCGLTLTYAPAAADSGTLTLPFTNNANNGSLKSGTLSIAFTARMVTLRLLAGSSGGSGYLDAVGTAARFNAPSGVVADGAGNLYVTDGGSMIRKITPAYAVTTFAGSVTSGAADGVGAAARFNHPSGIAIDTTGNLYVADTGNSTIRKITPGGVVTTLAGSPGTSGTADGTGPAARFSSPSAVTVDSTGAVYVADMGANSVRRITPAAVVTTVVPGGTGLYLPQGIAVSSGGTVYVADTENNLIRQITSQGVMTTLAGSGLDACGDGTGAAAGFSKPYGMSIDGSGTLYVTENANRVRTVTPQGVVATVAGACSQGGSVDGTGPAARFTMPMDVAVGDGGVVYVADTGNNTIRSIDPSNVVTTVAGAASVRGAADGTGAAAQFFDPGDVTVCPSGDLYLADTGNSEVRKITAEGVVSTFAVLNTTYLGSDPAGIACGNDGTIYVTSGISYVQKITPQGVVTPFAGDPAMPGYADGIGSAARFSDPGGIAVNSAGVVYVGDSANCAIRMITQNGTVTTLGGSTRQCGTTDGSGVPLVWRPTNLALDGSGNIFVGDEANQTIYRVTPQGAVTTIVSGMGLAFYRYGTLAVDAAGDLYLADTNNHEIRKITPQGTVTTIIGTQRRNGIALDPLPASLASPAALAVLPTGQLVIVDLNSVLVTDGL